MALRLLIDLDGVLYRGRRALPGVRELFEWIEARGHSYSLVTNNSTRPPDEVAAQLRGFGLAVPPDHITTSALATARWLHERAGKGARVQVLGGPGLLQAIFDPALGFRPDWYSPEWLVAGSDFDLTYQKLTAACFAVQRGAQFIATNPDTTFPTEQGITPGAGAIQAVITLVTGIRPTVIGKPEPAIYEMALRTMPENGEVVVLGDRLDTDILAGQRLGLKTVLLLTGVSTREEAETGEIRPDFVFEDLCHFLAHADDL